ncbi:MAG: hypothetical protein R6X35_08155 [Candidatus Krumholzibacteriia bacterium]
MTASPHLFTPFLDKPESFTVDAALVAAAQLEAWAKRFALGTAGYRDLLNPDDLFDLTVPFNGLTVAVMLEARARLAVAKGLRRLHVGGEVRAHTQELIDLAARLYAAHGLEVHVRPEGRPTTPIWLSSFGVFFEELDGGENFTASHSQSYKGGWKPMDSTGGQLLEMAGAVADQVRTLVAEAAAGGLEIRLAGAGDPLIVRTFEPTDAYVQVLRTVVPAGLLAEVPAAGQEGFRAAFSTEGGSMGAAGRDVFARLGIGMDAQGPVFFTHEQEDPNYHGIGILDGVNHGVDPGKWQVYKHIGAQELLRDGACHVFFIWDPDGDRFNMVTTAPARLADTARAAGLEVDPLDEDRCLVFFKPNQVYFMLTAVKLAALQESGELDRANWIVATTWPTSMSIGEIARRANERTGAGLSTFRVPVGFKHFAALVTSLEEQIAAGSPACRAVDVTGAETVFGPRPRMLIMAEESGGAAMGPAEPAPSRTGARTSLAPKEKDAMQLGVMALCLAARLHRAGGSFAAFYLEQLEAWDTRYRFYERRDVTLFDEALTGPAREDARVAGNRRKDATVAFFRALEELTPREATRRLVVAMPEGSFLPTIERVFDAGDGTFIEFAGQWFELRASGTDAVLRYYMEGADAQLVAELNEAFTRLDIPAQEG